MSLTILSVAYPLSPVRFDTSGGAEQVLAMLDAALTRAGHYSMVVACEGSMTQGRLIPTPRIEGQLDERARQSAHEQHRRAIMEALNQRPVDLVHMHGLDFACYLPPPGPPVLITLHLPLSWYAPGSFRPDRPRTYLHGVSAAQRRICPEGIDLLPDIENGVPVDQLYLRISKRHFALALGRICPEKGYHLALEAAWKARTPMVLAGEVFRYEAHERYFREKIRPNLAERYRYIGPIGFPRKRRLLTAARCLLAPSLVPETSSLVTMEALACGTPVIAFPSGALTDLIDHGKTGYLVHDTSEMAEAIQAAAGLDSDLCRQVARERFSADRMIQRYLDLYEQLTSNYIM